MQAPSHRLRDVTESPSPQMGRLGELVSLWTGPDISHEQRTLLEAFEMHLDAADARVPYRAMLKGREVEVGTLSGRARSHTRMRVAP